MIPTALYIHIPWCIQKCPYCDFNSHKAPMNIQENQYIEKLLADLHTDIGRYGARPINAIFIGGGTPSLLSGSAMAYLMQSIRSLLPVPADIEITMEANPGTAEQQRFEHYRNAGINRLSIGIQSFDDNKLKSLGRIHGKLEAENAIIMARQAGFDNINLDIMHGLPNQSIAQSLDDLASAIEQKPNHLSWYQLTLEPNTVFYKKPPKLPNEDVCAQMEEQGFKLLNQAGFNRYEISAFSKSGCESKHNLNYWTYGDYFGIGAGAHGKLTIPEGNRVIRTQKKRQPKDYLNAPLLSLAQENEIDSDNRLFEFMLNTSRLQCEIPIRLFEQRALSSKDKLMKHLQTAENQGLIQYNNSGWQITEQGRRFTNNLQALFLPEDN